MSRDVSASNKRITNLSFSFIFTLAVLVELMILIFTLLGGYFVLKNYSEELEFLFLENTKQFTVSVAAGTQEAVAKSDYSRLTKSYLNSIKNASANDGEIKEIFFLSASGVIKAHNDYSEIANPSLGTVKQISARYNTAFFHKALQTSEAKVLVQDYHILALEDSLKLNSLLQIILPKELSFASDFSTAIFIKGKPIGTLHIIASRSYIKNFLLKSLHDYLFLVLFFLLAGLLLTFLIVILFSMRIHYLENIWKNIFSADENLRSTLNQFEKKIKHFESPQNFFSPLNMANKEKKEKEISKDFSVKEEKPLQNSKEDNQILEAIFVEE